MTLQDSWVASAAYKHRIISLNLEKLGGIYISMGSYLDICGITECLNKLALLFQPFYFWQSFISIKYATGRQATL